MPHTPWDLTKVAPHHVRPHIGWGVRFRFRYERTFGHARPNGAHKRVTRAVRQELDVEIRTWHERGETDSASAPSLERCLSALSLEPTLHYSRLRVYLDPTLRMLAETQVRVPHEQPLDWTSVLACVKATGEMANGMAREAGASLQEVTRITARETASAAREVVKRSEEAVNSTVTLSSRTCRVERSPASHACTSPSTDRRPAFDGFR